MSAIYYLYTKGQRMGDHRADKILEIENLASFERLVNRDHTPYEDDMMILPGTLPDKHKNIDLSTGVPALRNRFHLIYLLLGGDHEINIGEDHYRLRPNDLVIIPENIVYEILHISRCRGYYIHFLSELLLPLIRSPIASEFPFLDVEAVHVINLSDDESRSVQHSFQDIIREYHTFYATEKDNLLKHYLEILLIRIREIFLPYSKIKVLSDNKALNTANRFKVMVEKNIRQIRQVKDYAAMLNISAGHLSHTVQEAFGKSPRDVINDVLLLEAKMLLSATDKSLIEIAYLLQFNDQSHFNHFMKHHTALSPKELRKIL